jgi:hypothetical protein
MAEKTAKNGENGEKTTENGKKSAENGENGKKIAENGGKTAENGEKRDYGRLWMYFY